MLKHVQDINSRRIKVSSMASRPISPPKWVEPPIRHYKELGERLGINGDEIDIMLEHALKIQDPTCLKLFERFLFAAKLVSAEPLAAHHAVRKQRYDAHLNAVAKHERQMEQLARQNARIKGTNAEVIEQVNRRWKKLVEFIANRASQVAGLSEFTFEESIVFEVLAECQMATFDPIEVDTSLALALSFNEIGNATAYMEQQMLGSPKPWHPRPLEDDGVDPDWESMEYWDEHAKDSF